MAITFGSLEIILPPSPAIVPNKSLAITFLSVWPLTYTLAIPAPSLFLHDLFNVPFSKPPLQFPASSDPIKLWPPLSFFRRIWLRLHRLHSDVCPSPLLFLIFIQKAGGGRHRHYSHKSNHDELSTTMDMPFADASGAPR
jgi:hypothetical protein